MLDLEELRDEIRTMSRKTMLYRLLKEELTALGYWRNKIRGNPSRGYEAQQRTLARG